MASVSLNQSIARVAAGAFGFLTQKKQEAGDGSANISAKKEGLTHTEARRSFAIMVQQRGLKPEQAKRLSLRFVRSAALHPEHALVR
jgi:hypothetical protein